jgi:hypothetical protein
MKYLEFGDYEIEKINEVHATGYIIGIFICLIWIENKLKVIHFLMWLPTKYNRKKHNSDLLVPKDGK